MSKSKYLFKKNEILLCYHGPLIYKAKCLEQRLVGKKREYFIHYMGWNSRWEEWVDNSRAMKLNPANIDKMISLKNKHTPSKICTQKHSVVKTKKKKTSKTKSISNKKIKLSEISTKLTQKLDESLHSKTMTEKQRQSSECLNNSKIISERVINETQQNATTSTNRANVFENMYVTRSKMKKCIKAEVTDNIKGIELCETSVAVKIEASEAYITEVFDQKLVITKPIKMEVAEFNEEAVVSTDTEEVNVIPHHNNTNITVESETAEANLDIIFDKLIITEPNNANAEITQEVDITEPTEVIIIKGTEPNKEHIVVDVPDRESYENTQLNIIPMLKIEIQGINMPRALSERLAYDFFMTTQFKKVLKFPNIYTIDKLMYAFIIANSESECDDKEAALSTSRILIHAFNGLQHNQLIYHEEKIYGIKEKATAHLKRKGMNGLLTNINFLRDQQSTEAWHHVYGPTNLLRLFIKLPGILQSCSYTDAERRFVILNFETFLKFLADNYDTYFTADDYMLRE